MDQTAGSSSEKISGEAKVPGPESKLVGSRNKLFEREGGQKPTHKNLPFFRLLLIVVKVFFDVWLSGHLELLSIRHWKKFWNPLRPGGVPVQSLEIAKKPLTLSENLSY